MSFSNFGFASRRFPVNNPYAEGLIDKAVKLGTPKALELAEELMVAEGELKHAEEDVYAELVDEANWYQRELKKELRKHGVRVA